jgi:hypothetical protein
MDLGITRTSPGTLARSFTHGFLPWWQGFPTRAGISLDGLFDGLTKCIRLQSRQFEEKRAQPEK